MTYFPRPSHQPPALRSSLRLCLVSVLRHTHSDTELLPQENPPCHPPSQPRPPPPPLPAQRRGSRCLESCKYARSDFHWAALSRACGDGPWHLPSAGDEAFLPVAPGSQRSENFHSEHPVLLHVLGAKMTDTVAQSAKGEEGQAWGTQALPGKAPSSCPWKWGQSGRDRLLTGPVAPESRRNENALCPVSQL